MTIAIVNNFPKKTGIGKYAFNLFYELNKKQPNFAEMIYLESKDNQQSHEKSVTKIRQDFSIPFFNKTFSWYYYFPARLPKNFSLYHLSSHYLSRAVSKVSPCIVTHMDLATVLFPKDYNFFLRFFVKKLFNYYSLMEKIIVISESSAKELVEKKLVDESKIEIIPSGFDSKIFFPVKKENARKELGLPLEKKIVLHVGSEEKRKNVGTLFEAFIEVKKHEQDSLLVRVGGKNNGLEKLRKKANPLYFHGVPEEKLRLFYSACDVFVFPATYEGGFAYPPLEAMACGVPTVVGKELLLFSKGAKILENVYDKTEIADSIAGAFTKNISKKMAKNALEASKDFTMEIQAKKTLEVYKKVLQ